MIEEVDTDRVIRTEVRPVKPGDFRGLGSGWRFDCRAAVEGMEVFKLIDPEAPEAVVGLRTEAVLELCRGNARRVSPAKCRTSQAFSGEYLKSLFAFAAQLSFERGGEGFLVIDAKTELLSTINAPTVSRDSDTARGWFSPSELPRE